MALCEELKIKLTLLAEGSLANDDKATVEEHLRGCPACRASLEETRKLVAILSLSKLPEPSADFLERLPHSVYNEVASQRQKPRLLTLRARKFTAAAGLAAAILILIFSSVSFQNRRYETSIRSALNQPLSSEDVVIRTFTYSPPAVKPAANHSQNNEVNVAENAEPRDIETIDNQMSETLSPSSGDLFNVIEAVSDDEAKEMLNSLGNT
jgi:hypothetical protein